MRSYSGYSNCRHAAPRLGNWEIFKTWVAITCNLQSYCHNELIPWLVSGWNLGLETPYKQTGKLSLRSPHPFYSLCLCAPGKVCEWVAAPSSSSVCSGVSRSQEVIEFPLLKISISAPSGYPSKMKCTADVYVCFVVGVWREKPQLATQSERVQL